MSAIVRSLCLAGLGLSFGTLATASTLDLDARVRARHAIERVWWSHRIWPEENAGPKPDLDDVLPDSVLCEMVEDDLRKSNALGKLGAAPITPGDLSAEMKRMAEQSAAPTVLRELYAVLGNDPFLIAETLARPALAERRLGELYTSRREDHGSFDAWWAEVRASVPAKLETPAHPYELIVPAGDTLCVEDTWRATSDANVPGKPDARHWHSSVWTGSEMIVWGGRTFTDIPFATGGRYIPATDSWVTMTSVGVPSARSLHTAVWTGTEMIVWGGVGGPAFNTGGRYNPTTNTWTATTTTNAPPAAYAHAAIWTGSEMIVWGGQNSFVLNSGGRYNPTSNSWIATTTTAAPTAREFHTAVRAGSEMIVWGGDDSGMSISNSGGHYTSGAPQWTATTLTGAPSPRTNHTAVWTGSRMVVWGGAGGGAFNSGGRYDPTTDPPLWSPTTLTNAPTERTLHTAVWTGCEMIVWGGFGSPNPNTEVGGRYDPTANRWFPTSIVNVPFARFAQTAVWTGEEMIAWGGTTSSADTSTGGRYCACRCPITPVTGTPQLKFNTKVQLTWSLLASAPAYDLVRGDLALLRSSGGNFTSATTLCAGEDVAAVIASDTTVPAVGSGLWYVLRGVDRCSASVGTYDSGAASQSGLRDAEIAASGNDCTP